MFLLKHISIKKVKYMDYVLFTKYLEIQLVILVLSYIITRIGQDNTIMNTYSFTFNSINYCTLNIIIRGAYINEVLYFLLSLVEVLVWLLIMTLPLIALHYMHKIIAKVYKLHKDCVETLRS